MLTVPKVKDDCGDTWGEDLRDLSDVATLGDTGGKMAATEHDNDCESTPTGRDLGISSILVVNSAVDNNDPIQ